MNVKASLVCEKIGLAGASSARSAMGRASRARSGVLFSLGLGLCSLVACGSSSPAPAKVQTIMATTFVSDPTLQDSNGDGVLDWVIRDRESDHLDQDTKFSITGGVLREDGGDTGSDLLDSRPRMDYPNHTELSWSARSLSNKDFEAPTVGQIYTQWGWVGAQTWINVDYDVPNAHWAAVFAMIYRRATDQVMMVVNQIDDAPGPPTSSIGSYTYRRVCPSRTSSTSSFTFTFPRQWSVSA